MSDTRYYIDGKWQTAQDLVSREGNETARAKIDAYNQGFNAKNLIWDDQGMRAEEIPMSSLQGGEGTDTLLGGRQGYANPVSGTWAAKSSSPFGASRSAGRRLHAGNDLQAANGTPAVATIGGKVIYAGHNQGYQWNAVVLGDDGNAYRYATHGPLDVKIGDRVEQGQPVGTIARNHLHFEVIPPGPTLDKMVAAAAKNAFVGTSWRPGQAPTTEDPATFFDMDRGERIHAGDVFEDEGPPLASRVASELDVPPSWPSPQEATRMLAERGYTGPDAVMAFQENELLSTRPSGSMDAETVAALMNPNPITPPERPNLIAGSSGTDSLRSGQPDTLVGGIGPKAPEQVPISPPPRPNWAQGLDATTNFQKPPDVLGGLPPKPSEGLGAVAAQPAPKGLPTPPTRPAGLGAAGQEMPGNYRRLRVGDSGEDVRRVQSQLSSVGFNPGPLDGRYGPKTAAAVLAFQRTDPDRVGGKIDAIAGPYTQAALHDVTQNSTLSSLSDPSGIPSGAPSGLEVARTLGRSPWTAPKETTTFDPGGGTGRDSRPPGTVPAADRPPAPVVERPLTSGDRSMITSRAFRPMEAKPWNPWGGMGTTVRETPLMTSGPRPEDGSGLVAGTPPPGSREPAPLSPVNVITSMGGTGSSGLGPAGTSGPGPGSGFESGSGMTDDEDEDTISGYNESFSTTGWL